MKILAINTSSIMADVALKNDANEVFKKVDSSQKHSESLMLNVDEVLYGQNLTPNSLDAMAVVVGPGSFTGIRIGVAISKGFEIVRQNLKLISITAFEFMKAEFLKKNPDFSGEFICVINALSGKFYVQTFNKTEETKAELIEGKEFFVGKETIVGLAEEKLVFATDYVEYSPETLLNIAKEKFMEDDFVEELIPLYLRKSQAEDNLDKKAETND